MPVAQPFTNCRSGDIAPQVVITSIDEAFEASRDVLNVQREIQGRSGFRVVTGSYRGVGITVVFVPPGAPLTAIAVEELSRLGARMFIGLWGGVALTTSLSIGDIVLASSAVKGDGVSRYYLPAEVPASADFELLQRIVQVLQVKSIRYVIAPVWSNDVYYINSFEERNGGLIRVYSRVAAAMDMSTAALYTLALMKRLTAASVVVVEANPLRGIASGELLSQEAEKAKLREELIENVARISRAVIEAMSLHYEHVKMERRSEHRVREVQR